MPEPVGLDCVGNRVDKFCGVAREKLACPLRAQQVMVFAVSALCYVVQQRGSPNDRQVRALRLRNALGQHGHPQDVVEVMPSAPRFV